jgi:hypothetical protein
MLREALRNGAHLAVLSAFALAQPLFDILGKNAEFFAARGSTSREIVLFAAALVLLPPVALLLVEVLVSLVSRPAADALHLIFVGALTSLIALQLIKRIDGMPALVVAALAVTVAAVVTVAYVRTRLVPGVLTALTPAPLVFVALFLFATPVWKLVNVENVAVQTSTVRSSTPVVLVVFDEFSTNALLDERNRIDAVRYPNFAALARGSLWFRNATTVHGHTEQAVPAILTGQLPRKNALPISSDHPRNLFTLVGRKYRMQVLEALTHLCPPKLCNTKAPRQSEEAEDTEDAVRAAGTEELVSDTGVVYLHVLLPDAWTGRLPPISDSWTNFRGGHAERQEAGACGRQICKFTARMTRTKQPSLYFVHSLLPHVPWQYLPGGRRYANDVRRIPGNQDGRWTSDQWLALQAYQRYLLQVGYTDSGLGLVLKRLRATGLYDRALVIVTADHGVSFSPNETRRVVTPRNLHEIAFMPLFVKLPGQHVGRIVDGLARTIDVLPTIADVLDFRAWRFDGRSLLGNLPRDGTITVQSNVSTVSASLSSLLARRRAALARQIAVFGTGSFERVYRIGPNRDLLGKPVSTFQTTTSAKAHVDVNGASLLGNVDPASDLIPCYLTGTLTGVRGPLDLAIALNGEIAAVTRTYSSLGQTQFAAMVPPSALRAGANSLGMFAVHRANGRTALEQLGGDALAFTLGASQITSTDGKAIRVQPRALQGTVREQVRPDTVLFGGWAVDTRARRPADSIVVFVRGTSVYAGSATNFDSPVAYKRFGVQHAGFIFELPRRLLGDNPASVRVFALRGGIASQLPLRR